MSVSANDRLLAERYELAELLGSGAVAEVRRAWDTRLQRHVAVTLFGAGSDVADVLRFDTEVKTLATLSPTCSPMVHSFLTASNTGPQPRVPAGHTLNGGCCNSLCRSVSSS